MTIVDKQAVVAHLLNLKATGERLEAEQRQVEKNYRDALDFLFPRGMVYFTASDLEVPLELEKVVLGINGRFSFLPRGFRGSYYDRPEWVSGPPELVSLLKELGYHE